MQRIRLIRTAVGAIAILACAPLFAGGDPASAGEKPYMSKCASCHAKDGSGNTTMGKKLALRDLRSADVQKQTDQQLYTITAKGKGKMPAYEKKLSAEEINEVVAFIRQIGAK